MCGFRHRLRARPHPRFPLGSHPALRYASTIAKVILRMVFVMTGKTQTHLSVRMDTTVMIVANDTSRWLLQSPPRSRLRWQSTTRCVETTANTLPMEFATTGALVRQTVSACWAAIAQTVDSATCLSHQAPHHRRLRHHRFPHRHRLLCRPRRSLRRLRHRSRRHRRAYLLQTRRCHQNTTCT